MLRGGVSSRLKVAPLWHLLDMMVNGFRCINFCLVIVGNSTFIENVHVHYADRFGCVFIL